VSGEGLLRKCEAKFDSCLSWRAVIMQEMGRAITGCESAIRVTTTEAEARVKGDSHLHGSDGAPSAVPRSGSQEAVWVGSLLPVPVVVEGVLAEESERSIGASHGVHFVKVGLLDSFVVRPPVLGES
jgi:hypothetical protein